MNGWEYMLKNNRAPAFYDKKEKVDRIQKDNQILLYHKDIGFIACAPLGRESRAVTIAAMRARSIMCR